MAEVVNIRELPALRIVICREDLPPNPRWRLRNYPDEHCWGLEELVREAVEKGEGSLIYKHARRIWWEFWHRVHGTYKRNRPLPRVYICYRTCVPLNLPKDRLVELIYHFLAALGVVYGLIPRRRTVVLA